MNLTLTCLFSKSDNVRALASNTRTRQYRPSTRTYGHELSKKILVRLVYQSMSI